MIQSCDVVSFSGFSFTDFFFFNVSVMNSDERSVQESFQQKTLIGK